MVPTDNESTKAQRGEVTCSSPTASQCRSQTWDTFCYDCAAWDGITPANDDLHVSFRAVCPLGTNVIHGLSLGAFAAGRWGIVKAMQEKGLECLTQISDLLSIHPK